MASALKAYIANKIFTGENWISGHAIITEGGKIKELVPVGSLPSSIATDVFDNCMLAPAFIDLQIYGASGKLLAVYPETDSLVKLNAYGRKAGTAYCMPTVATNTIDVFYKCIDAIRDYWNGNGKGILGLHIEGPWINPAKRGAHIESLIHSPSLKEVDELLSYGKGVIKIITLAPEQCDKEIIDRILSDNIIISAGHSNATYEQAKTGFANGITAVTHLYNAMSPLQHRQPGLTGATLDDASVMASIIPDGHHVSYAAISIAKKVMGKRLFAITDGVTETIDGFYPHQLAGDKYEASGILSGSALTMEKALKNLVEYVGIELSEALRMCSLYPAQVIKMDRIVGRIAPGYNADIVVVDNGLSITSTNYSESE